MAKCNGNHNMQETHRSYGDCVEDPQTGRKERKVTIHKKCCNEECSAAGVSYEWESC